MTDVVSRPGGVATGVASAAVAAAVSTAIVVPSEQQRLAATLVVAGLIALALALAVGLPRLAGFSGVPVLAAAVIHIQTTDDSVALWALAVGCGWYLTVELAWESIRRRIECRFEPGLARQRTREILTVVVLACAIAAAGLAASTAAPRRTLLIEAAVIAAVLAGAGAVVRRLSRAAGQTQ